MIKRVIAFLALTLCVCLTAMAQNMQLSIKLDNDKNKTQTENLGFANVTFEYLYNVQNDAVVRVTVENMMSDQCAILLFKNDDKEVVIKKMKPKIEFDKNFPGKKGTRVVRGCNESVKYGYLDVNPSYVHIIFPAVTDNVFLMDVPFTSSKNFLLPLYVAKYKVKDLKKGYGKIKYQILEEYLYDVNIEVVGWTEDDSTYVATKKDVENFISSLDTVKFCNNKKHAPSLKEQQRPYQERKDSLIQGIMGILDAHTEWMSVNPPHIAYSQLLSELETVDLDEMTYDCGNHKDKPGHICSYCSLSTQEISQRLDDLYQQLYAGTISKDQAMRSARWLYNCYKENKKRKKDNFYGAKITKFYNGISNY